MALVGELDGFLLNVAQYLLTLLQWIDEKCHSQIRRTQRIGYGVVYQFGFIVVFLCPSDFWVNGERYGAYSDCDAVSVCAFGIGNRDVGFRSTDPLVSGWKEKRSCFVVGYDSCCIVSFNVYCICLFVSTEIIVTVHF